MEKIHKWRQTVRKPWRKKRCCPVRIHSQHSSQYKAAPQPGGFAAGVTVSRGVRAAVVFAQPGRKANAENPTNLCDRKMTSFPLSAVIIPCHEQNDDGGKADIERMRTPL